MSPMEQQRLARSPFAIPREDVGALLRDEGFGLLRRCLAGANRYVNCALDPCYISPAFLCNEMETWVGAHVLCTLLTCR